MSYIISNGNKYSEYITFKLFYFFIIYVLEIIYVHLLDNVFLQCVVQITVVCFSQFLTYWHKVGS